jgi:hypothetical protein
VAPEPGGTFALELVMGCAYGVIRRVWLPSPRHLWFVTDHAHRLDAGGNVNPQQVLQCFAVSKTGDPVTGGWSFYSIEVPSGRDDSPRFGVWPDGLYMSANMSGYGANSAFIGPHVWAIDKAQMYAGDPAVQVVDFAEPSADFGLLPANARLQAGTPPAGAPGYFVSTWGFLNALTVYKLHVDWNRISTSTFTGPDTPLNATSWPNAGVPNAPTPGNSLDTQQIRAMAQAQYSNIGGAESLWSPTPCAARTPAARPLRGGISSTSPAGPSRPTRFRAPPGIRTGRIHPSVSCPASRSIGWAIWRWATPVRTRRRILRSPTPAGSRAIRSTRSARASRP